MQQNAELRRRLQKIHAESSVIGPATEPRFISSNNDVPLHVSMHAPLDARMARLVLWFTVVAYMLHSSTVLVLGGGVA